MGDGVWHMHHPDGPSALAQGTQGPSKLLSLTLLVLEDGVCRNILDPLPILGWQRQRSLTTKRTPSSCPDIALPQRENCQHVGLGSGTVQPLYILQ